MSAGWEGRRMSGASGQQHGWSAAADGSMVGLHPLRAAAHTPHIHKATCRLIPPPPCAQPHLTRSPSPHPLRSVEFLQRECAAKRVYVLPAFETPRNPDAAAAHRVAGEAVTTDKRGLKGLVDKRLVHQVQARLRAPCPLSAPRAPSAPCSCAQLRVLWGPRQPAAHASLCGAPQHRLTCPTRSHLCAGRLTHINPPPPHTHTYQPIPPPSLRSTCSRRATT